MNFLAAIKHAAIGYGIRRKVWHSKAILHLNNLCELEWCCDCDSHIAPLLGPDPAASVNAEDIKATDWETV